MFNPYWSHHWYVHMPCLCLFLVFVFLISRLPCPQHCPSENKTMKSQGSSDKPAEKSASGCDCSWIGNDDCISQDACAVSCRQQHGSPCAAKPTDAGCKASCDSAYASCDRWCHISDATGSYYTAAEEEAMKGQIMQCAGQCTVTRGTCYANSCGNWHHVCFSCLCWISCRFFLSLLVV